MKTIRILTLLHLAFLTGCEGLAVAYTRNVGGQNLTGFLAPDGTYGITGHKATGKQPVKVQK